MLHVAYFGTETKREVWLLRTGFGIALANKLVSLTWLLWALRSFQSITLHYIISLLCLNHLLAKYPSLHLVFGMTYHLNSAPFLYLHRPHCQSQDIIFIRLLSPSPPSPPLSIK